MEDVRALPQSMAQFSHQGAGFFQSSLVFKPLNHSKASDVRDGSLPCLGYHGQLLILRGRQLELNGDSGHKLISLCFATEMTAVRVTKRLGGIISHKE
jgi:hypothetical protein